MGASSSEVSPTTIVLAILLVVGGICIGLRFYVRVSTKVGTASDDWWLLISFLLSASTGAIILWGIKSDPAGGKGIDRDSPNFEYAPHTKYLQANFIVAILYFAIVTSIKLSILLMYRRIFSVAYFRIYSLAVGVVVLLFWLAGTLSVVVSCIPVERLWIGPSAGGYCFNFNIFWMVMGAVEIVIDTVILVMPVRMVLGLQLSRKHKIMLAGIFLLGGFVVITGLLRVVKGYKPGSQNVAFSKAELWSGIHVGVAIVCACLPTFRPLVTRASSTIFSLRQRLYGSRGKYDGSTSSEAAGSGSLPDERSKSKALVENWPLSRLGHTYKADDQHSDTVRLTENNKGQATAEHVQSVPEYASPSGRTTIESRADVV